MANAAAVYPCHFRWNISNPFVPWQRIDTTFFLRFPTLTRWTVAIEPIYRDLDVWQFSFHLGYSVLGNRNFTVADKIEVSISLNETLVENQEDNPHPIRDRYWYTWQFHLKVTARPMMHQPHRLDIAIVISFRNQNMPCQGGNGLLVYDHEDLSKLSKDLGKLLTSGTYSNMRLTAKDPASSIPVHSYILDARWCEFFRKHSINTTSSTVDTNISSDVLRDILTYVYSGQVSHISDKLGNTAYATELFKVIDRYNFHHLYKAFVRDDSQQVQTTTRNWTSHSGSFRLDEGEGWIITDPVSVWNVNPNTNPNIELVFRIQFFLQTANPWFQYFIVSRSTIEIHVQVNLAYTISFDTNISGSATFHGCNYKIQPNEFVASGGFEFEDPYIGLGVNPRCRPRKLERQITVRFIRCLLFLSDGSSVINVESEDNIGLQDDRERFEVLSDHMNASLVTVKDSDLRITCPLESPIEPNPHTDTYVLHKSIFAIRVPMWRRVLEDPPIEDDLPNVVECRLPSEAFKDVVRYIYTGKSYPIQPQFLDEVENFAELGEFHSLRRLVNRMRASE